MILSRSGYLIREGFRSIKTHAFMSFASVTIIMACLIIMGSVTLLSFNIDAMIQSLEDRNEVVAFVDEELTPDQAEALRPAVEAVPNVQEVFFMTREEAMSYTIPDVIGGYDNWRPDRRTPTWFLCGDSTMANYPASAYPMMGWGQSLQSLLPGDVYVENCAVNGRSSKSFIAEKRLNFIELCLRPGDKLIVSFSHNDEKPAGTFHHRRRSAHGSMFHTGIAVQGRL